MCRYAFHEYRDHLACFHCRKTFKQWLRKPRKEESRVSARRYEPDGREVSCPQCARPMANMGLDFRAPRKTDVEAWEVLSFLYEKGFAFHGCGCNAGCYVPPKKRRDIPAFLKASLELTTKRPARAYMQRRP